MTELSFTLHWIVAFPLIGAVLNLVVGPGAMRMLGAGRGREVVHLVGVGAIAFSFFFTISVVQEQLVRAGYRSMTEHVYRWIDNGSIHVGFDLALDPLAGVLCLLVTVVSLIAHLFSVGAMVEEHRYPRFFGLLNLLTASTLLVLLGKSLWVLFVGWQGVAASTYLLSGYWMPRHEAEPKTRSALIAQRIGDLGLVFGMLLLFVVAGSLDFDAVRTVLSGASSPLVTTTFFGVPVVVLVALTMGVGCAAKAAQVPFSRGYVDVAIGPLPAVALLLSASSGLVGSYVVLRLANLFSQAPAAMNVLMIVGAITAVSTGLTSLWQRELVRALALASASHLGLVFLALGSGSFDAALGHLVTHGLVMAGWVLAFGGAMEACRGRGELRALGGLRAKLPVTAAGAVLCSLILLGSGIVLSVRVAGPLLGSPTGIGCLLASCVALGCAGYQSVRLYLLVFEGRFRGDTHTWNQVGELAITTGPVLVLAALGATGPFWGSWVGVEFPGLQGSWLGLLGVFAVLSGGGVAAMRPRLPSADVADEWAPRGLRSVMTGVHRGGEGLLLGGLVDALVAAVLQISETVRRIHDGRARRMVVAVVVGTVIVLGSVFANPRVVSWGPSRLNRWDLGGLKPAFGGRAPRLSPPRELGEAHR